MVEHDGFYPPKLAQQLVDPPVPFAWAAQTPNDTVVF